VAALLNMVGILFLSLDPPTKRVMITRGTPTR